MKTGPTLKLLAIDDDPSNLELISLALQRRGLEITTSQDPEAGFDLFLRMRPKIVLLDLIMPNVNGIELLERMVSIDPGVDVILITAHYSAESAVEAYRTRHCNRTC
jgi:DNA-binding NtrC family response regulator